MSKANKIKKPFHSYYSVIAKACNCSHTYVRMVLNDELGEYSKRDNDLVRSIRDKAKEINEIFNSK